ncbi:hypothetical protein [Rubrivirga sp.]|uniref:hypothetical protein n=1 Tax=Rubrivirga sp. TaxID=1885344 RepID=UPI003C71961A
MGSPCLQPTPNVPPRGRGAGLEDARDDEARPRALPAWLSEPGALNARGAVLEVVDHLHRSRPVLEGG